MIRLFALLLLLAAPAAAQDLPALFDVTDVATDDVLNVRDRPEAGAGLVGTLAHDARDIEVVTTRGAWGRVNVGERAGWVAMRFLDRQPGSWQDFDAPLDCFGTEPFWDATLSPFAASRLGGLGMASRTLDPRVDTGPLGPGGASRRIVMFSTPDGAMTALVETNACNDGMSDRNFGLSIALAADRLAGGGSGGTLYGCCTLGH